MTSAHSSDPFGNFTQKQPTQERRVTNFFEAFQESAKKTPRMTLSPAGELRPDMPVKVSEAVQFRDMQKREEQARAQERMFARQREEEQQTRLKTRQEQVEKHINELRESILKIAKSTKNVGSEIEKAAFEAPIAPGAYHLSFFEKLKDALEIIKRRLDDSASWLHTMNKRNKRMPFYWAQVKKSGTKFMFSQERYMSTSAG